MNTLYGIANCDTVKKARKWLEHNHINYVFHDFRKDGIDKQLIEHWLKSIDWETLINKRSTTWRGLDEDTKSNMDSNIAINEILNQPTLVKRPVFDNGRTILIGFSEKQYQELM